MSTPVLRIDNYIITTSLYDILTHLKVVLTNGKLKDIVVSETGLKVTCPNDAHSNGLEHDPDCHINTSTKSEVPYGFFHCFACNAKGPFIKFVALCFSSSEDFAKAWLIQNYGELSTQSIILDDPINISKKHIKHKLDISELDQYQSWTPYLAKRKLSRDICEKFKVKYDPKYRQVIFPIKDENDNLVMLAKRSIDTKMFYMTKDVEKPVYGLNVINKNNIKAAMLVEGPIDMLTCWSNGIPAIATLGVVSTEQVKIINKSCLNVLYLCFDNDESGKKFTKFVKENLDSRIIAVEISLPVGRKDVNDLTESEWIDLIKKYM